MRKPVIAASLLVVLCAAVLGACGGSSSSDSQTVTKTVTVPTGKLSSTVAPLEEPYTGTYMGDTDDNREVRFSYKDGLMNSFTVGGHTLLNKVPVRNNRYVVHGTHGSYYEGTWQWSTSVEGFYSYYGSNGKLTTIRWTANAFAH